MEEGKTNVFRERLEKIRALMAQKKLTAYVVSGHDLHMSEATPQRWRTREWLSGFTGSAGTIVITADEAGLWTDPRYYLQAKLQLEGSGIRLYHMPSPKAQGWKEYLLEKLQTGERLGVDGHTFNAGDFRDLEWRLKRKNIRFSTTEDLIGKLWKDNREDEPRRQARRMPLSLAGEEMWSKIHRILPIAKEGQADAVLLASPDEVCWTFNLRGSDIAYNPVTLAFGYLSSEECILFITPSKVSEALERQLKEEGILLMRYEEVYAYLRQLPPLYRVCYDEEHANTSLYRALPALCRGSHPWSPVTLLKSIKNDVEQQGFRTAALRDGVALTRFFYWLERQMQKGAELTEISVSTKLSALRAESPEYLMDSFATICAYGGHGAQVHYSATAETNSRLLPQGVLLIDSGAHYNDGTTDVTRTIALGDASEQIKRDFTLVLKGMIALSICRFPSGTTGARLDVLARTALWGDGLQYLHGTGHGVGHCLHVHEGPQSIRMDNNPVELQPGMVLSNEPGIYREDEYGIRTENMMLVQESGETTFGNFLRFETLTLCFIDRRLLLPYLLSKEERDWLNTYHRTVLEKLSPFLNSDEQGWLQQQTAAL